eukprot:XP_016658060.1 PREDICTED: uncharacterized protein LOC107883108 [Acyrthosiphon pisum]
MDNQKQWSVRYFESEKTYSVVPSNWLVIQHGKYYCKWPKRQKVTSKMIMNAEDPSNKWLLYPINIIENSTFNTYEEAVKRERQIFISASESESGDPNIEKRKICNLNYESDDSSTLDGPPFKLYKNTTTVSNICSDQININHNYKGQNIQQNYESQIFPISCKYSKK